MKHLAGLLLLLTPMIAYCQKNDGDFHLDKSYSIAPDGLLDINIKDAKIDIVGSSRVDAHVTIDRSVVTKWRVAGHEEFSVDIREEDGSLVIREKSTSVAVVGYYNVKCKVSIELPQNASLKLKGADGDILVQNVNGSIEISSNDANIELTQCNGSAFDLRLNDGRIRMDMGQGKLTVKADDANVQIKNAKFSSINADLNDGDFILESALSENGEYFVETQDGSVNFTISAGGGKFDIHHNDGHVSTAGDFNVSEKSDNYSQLTLADGNARVKINTNDGNVRLIKK
jgi:hypothetical protein